MKQLLSLLGTWGIFTALGTTVAASVMPETSRTAAPRTLAPVAPLYANPHASVEARTRDLLGRMTLEEKVEMLYGDGDGMNSHANPRLGIPTIGMTDGPLGVRWNFATSFPSGILMGAAFDPALVGRVSGAMAVETLARGRDMLLGPCINIARAPQGGRNFESFGEDPFLTSAIVPEWVRGLQSRGVLASTKHFAMNDQETDRMIVDARADERTMHEIHLPAFRAAVDAGTWSIMAAYNKINGDYASASSYLIQTVLKDKWKFRGFVVSDWGAVHETTAVANAGTDLEMPSGEWFGGGKLLADVHAGRVTEAEIDDKVSRLLRAMFSIGLFERKDSDRPAESAVQSPEHLTLARETAEAGIVLLKNERAALPLVANAGAGAPFVATASAGAPFKIAVLGPNADRLRTGGGGSSLVNPGESAPSPLAALRAAAGPGLQISFAQGANLPGEGGALPPEVFRPAQPSAESGLVIPPGAHGLLGEYFDNMELQGKPKVTRLDPNLDFTWSGVRPAPEISWERYSVRWTGKYTPDRSGRFRLAVKSDDGARLWLDGKLLIDDWESHAAQTALASVTLEAGREYDLRVEYYQLVSNAEIHLALGPADDQPDALRDEAVELARRSDAAVIFAGYADFLESEGQDRASLSLPDGQDELIRRVAAVNPRTIVVIHSGGSTLMPWLDSVAAVVQAWYPGQEGGHALARLLLGQANFSGKLPVSFYRRAEDASSYGNYPGHGGVVRYAEGIFVGYRHLDRAGIEPLFAFGHGLSYTRFELRGLRTRVVDARARSPRVEVSLELANVGDRAGAEVVQLYVGEQHPTLARPAQELKAFRKVSLEPGRTAKVTLELDARAFAYYDSGIHDWRVNPGVFELRVGTSSRNLPLRDRIRLR